MKFHHLASVEIDGKSINVMKAEDFFAVDVARQKGKIAEMARVCFPDRQDLETIAASNELATYFAIGDGISILDWVNKNE